MLINNKEYIICSAIWFDDGVKHPHQPKNIDIGYVVCGRRHHNCFQIQFMIDINHIEREQGFLTNTDRFVDREEAGQIAYDAGQITEKNNFLFSEDLW
jgi:hypothetical protein